VTSLLEIHTSLVLERAAEYVERGWTQHAFARTADGGEVGSGHPDAVAWCAGAAIGRAATDLGLPHEEVMAAVRALRDHLDLPFDTWETPEGRVEEAFGAVARWNDTARALRADRVIAELRAAAAKASA
jgi:hypothetical protein